MGGGKWAEIKKLDCPQTECLQRRTAVDLKDKVGFLAIRSVRNWGCISLGTCTEGGSRRPKAARLHLSALHLYGFSGTRWVCASQLSRLTLWSCCSGGTCRTRSRGWPVTRRRGTSPETWWSAFAGDSCLVFEDMREWLIALKVPVCRSIYPI